MCWADCDAPVIRYRRPSVWCGIGHPWGEREPTGAFLTPVTRFLDTGSIVVVEDDRILLRSTAVLRMLSLLGFPFSMAAGFRLAPAGLRDLIYDFIARHRIRWFGRMSACRLPTPAERHRFL